jgi:hypothetical protein
MRQSGRAVALWAVGFYAISLLAVLPILAHWPWMAYNTADYKWQQLRQRLASAPDRPLLLMVGSSRTDNAFQSWRCNGLPCADGKALLAYNFGVPTAGPAHELLYVREMLEAGIRPRLLLIEFLPLLLNKPHPGIISEENWAAAPWRSLRQLVCLCPYFIHPGKKLLDWLEARLAPCYLFRYHFQRRVLAALFRDEPFEVDYTHDGWGRQLPDGPSAVQIAQRVAVTAHHYRPSLQHFRVGAGPRQALHDLLDLCHREQVPVMLVVTPESSICRSWYSPEAVLRARQLLAELSETYGVPVIDAWQWLPDTDFHDSHHVMASGSQRFTTRLLEEVAPRLQAPRDP